MKLILNRHFKGANYTIGRLFIDGKYFCDTLEDTVRNVKIPNETAIPAEAYEIILNMSPKFGRLLPRLLNVPNFEGILIHRGNTSTDTSGCILVGENKVKGMVINSTSYELSLVNLIQEAIDRSEKVTIEII